MKLQDFAASDLQSYINNNTSIICRAINIQFIRIFRLLKYSNTMRVFGYTVNDNSAIILAYFVINYQLKGILVIT